MADYLKGLFGVSQPSPAADDDFADFAHAPQPTPASISPVTATTASTGGATPTGLAGSPVLYTKWYRVWERSSPSDFISEAVILPFMIVIIAFHIWGRRTNKAKAVAWIKAIRPCLEKEYAFVGFDNAKNSGPSADEVQAQGLAKAMAESQGGATKEEGLLKERSAMEFATYATGRQNVAFTDGKLMLYKRYNPATLVVEAALGFLFESMPAPRENMSLTTYPFDGRERDLVPARSQEQKDAIEATARGNGSVYDGFVWAVVHKESMKRLRDERYDLSLTSTREHAKLPAWCVVMSESAEVTEALLTGELAKALEQAGDGFEFLIVSDMPLEKPQTLDETKPRKRISLSMNLPSNSASAKSYDPSLPLLNYFLRMPDHLTTSARFRPEVMKKIKAVREEEQKKISKASKEEEAEERRLESEKKKKEIRDNRMRGMSADEQRKFLEKERERTGKKQEKKMSRKA